MQIAPSNINSLNEKYEPLHREQYAYIAAQLERKNIHANQVVEKIRQFQVAIPSWALGAGGTRFGRFTIGGEPANLDQKIADVGIVHALTKSAGAISLHIPWDIPNDPQKTRELAASLGIAFDAVNSNTFQDQPGQLYSYKFGSLSNMNKASRDLAIQHNKEVIEYGIALGSKSITVWLADGSNFPGQQNFRKALEHTQESLQEIYRHLPEDWRMFIEYKPYEPNFYSTVIPDWGTSLMLAEGCGDRAFTLVDLGHHLPNTNIEQIVAKLMMRGRLGGFHFNDSKYGDDDLTCGSIKPYQLFLIFQELVYGMENKETYHPPIAWMIDASHNVKDPLEDLIQSLEAIKLAYAQALCIDQIELEDAQMKSDVVRCQEVLQDAYRMDLRPLLREVGRLSGAAMYPLEAYRSLNVRKNLIIERGAKTKATGL